MISEQWSMDIHYQTFRLQTVWRRAVSAADGARRGPVAVLRSGGEEGPAWRRGGTRRGDLFGEVPRAGETEERGKRSRWTLAEDGIPHRRRHELMAAQANGAPPYPGPPPEAGRPLAPAAPREERLRLAASLGHADQVLALISSGTPVTSDAVSAVAIAGKAEMAGR
ncbi:uncharacterized protein LOC119101761 [Pollicipes pollicipes]|uniref:uncharacterized protein LOC119101761 n=1 Tax=Pollicipes pollicipes TaxID=41117 RepID=UPI0018851E55|nr:uncharacterized protein LOC119101761 [Pollicipes pollicipes]